MLLSGLTLGFGCCLLPVAAWAGWNTLAASQAGRTPYEAASAALNSLEKPGDPDFLEVIVYLCDDHEDALRARLATIRDQLATDDGTFRLDISGHRTATHGDQATVTVDVGLIWTVRDPERGPLFLHTEPEVWTFTTTLDPGFLGIGRGWKVCAVDVPDLCETYIASC